MTIRTVVATGAKSRVASKRGIRRKHKVSRSDGGIVDS
jgi:hypothetical protein